MFRRSSSLVASLVGGTVLAALALALAGCGEEPTPPRLISFSPAALTVPANEMLAVSVEYEENDFALPDFQWSADAGEIKGNGAPSIIYRAPRIPATTRSRSRWATATTTRRCPWIRSSR